MVNSYQYWKSAVAGEKPKMFVDQPELGFYRKSLTERNDKGNNRRVGWTPVAVFMIGDVMTARIGSETDGRDVEGDALNELWSYIAGNAISEDWYRTVARHGQPWPDAHDPKKNKPIVTGVDMAAEGGDKTMTVERRGDTIVDVYEGTPEQKLIRDLTEQKAGVSQYAKIDSDTMAGQALSLKNTITALAGDLDKIREAMVRPHIDAQREVNNRLNPIINDAKAQSQTLLRAIGGWEDEKRAAARVAAEAAEKAERARLAAAAKAEQEGKPPPPPVVHAPPNAPPPSSQVAAAVGRKASVKVAKFVTDIDVDKAFAQFRTAPEVKEALMALAQRAVNAGLPVDGATIDERSVVR